MHRGERRQLEEASAESIKLMKQKLEGLAPPICPICKELLSLRLSTASSEVLEQLDSLSGAIARSVATRQLDLPLLLGALEQCAQLKLWHPPLHLDKPARELVELAIRIYVALIPRLSDSEREKAIQFCAESCTNGSADLKIEATGKLLPRLFFQSGGNDSLVRVYRDLFGRLRKAQNKEERTLLTAVFNGLQVAVAVASTSTQLTELWEQSFRIATTNVQWAWEGEGAPTIGTPWRIAMEKRLRRADATEKEHLSGVLGHYLVTPEAPLYSLSYHDIAWLFHAITQANGAKIRPFRLPDRAIVTGEDLWVQIKFRADPSVSLNAKLINFSLDDLGLAIQGRGAWAEGSENTQTVPNGGWRDASVTITGLQEGQILFNAAKVMGPILETRNARPYHGFRIQLGTSSPEEGIISLKTRWDNWPKR